MHGRRPVLYQASDKEDELDRLVGQVREWVDSGVEPSSIGVAARTNLLADAALSALRRTGVPACGMADTTPKDDAVRVGTMHRMKGLEFRCVGVIGTRKGPMPGAVASAEEDTVQHTQDLQRERCLLFVASTRARQALHVSWHGKPVPTRSRSDEGTGLTPRLRGPDPLDPPTTSYVRGPTPSSGGRGRHPRMNSRTSLASPGTGRSSVPARR